MFLALLASMCAFIVMLSMSYISTKISSELLDISDIIYQSAWYEHSEPSKKLLSLMLMKAQDTVSFTGFSIVSSTLETFVSVGEI